MATVTGFTAERMLVIENESVIDGEVVGNNLHLIQRGGVVIDAGNVRGATGATGATGPPGTNGTNGKDGLGVPAGGTIGQILTKNSATDNDSSWKDHNLPFAPVHYKARHGVQSIPRGTWTTVTVWNAAEENIGGITQSGGGFVIPTAGRYRITFACLFGIPTLTGWLAIQSQITGLNEGPIPQDIRAFRDPAGSNMALGPVITEANCNAGQNIKFQVYQAHPSAAMSLFGNYVGAEIHRVE